MKVFKKLTRRKFTERTIRKFLKLRTKLFGKFIKWQMRKHLQEDIGKVEQ